MVCEKRAEPTEATASGEGKNQQESRRGTDGASRKAQRQLSVRLRHKVISQRSRVDADKPGKTHKAEAAHTQKSNETRSIVL